MVTINILVKVLLNKYFIKYSSIESVKLTPAFNQLVVV